MGAIPSILLQYMDSVRTKEYYTISLSQTRSLLSSHIEYPHHISKANYIRTIRSDWQLRGHIRRRPHPIQPHLQMLQSWLNLLRISFCL